ncbi:helix-turn-helix domain-containing protein [Paenibacillus whitsoniae]|uniref:AraC family transcriptional regulator n=1 Tax=Paenibacillus whitsoniae TaxID=2496558 RepID=A0A430JIJ9_9BACL|nr:helix-turn-helix domain-containing protein [Paenibacillus whitsoniae]RTE10854.1 AraC family transcriptional regulator [Paenibacillus whitsoniae]
MTQRWLNRFGRVRENRSNQSQLFLRYLLSYVAVLLIPLIILGVLIYYSFFNILANELSKNNKNVLMQLQYTFDNKLIEMNKIAYQIYNDPKLTSYNMGVEKPLSVQDGITELKKYMVGNNLPYEVFVYYNDLDRLYSSSSAYSAADFLQYFHYANWNRDSFFQDMKSIRNNTTRQADDVSMYGVDTKMITYIVPNPNSSYLGNQITVFFMIDEKAVNKMLAYGDGDIILVNEASQIITSSKNAGYLRSDSLHSLIEQRTTGGSSSIMLEEHEFNTWTVESPNTSWRYLILLPANEAMKQLTYTKTLFAIALFCILMAAAGVIAYTMRLNYRPLRQLKAFAENKLGKLLHNVNEIEALRFTIDHIATAKEEWVRNSSLAVKEYILAKLLKGHYAEIRECNLEGKEIGLAFTKPKFRVALFLFKDYDFNGRPDRSQLISFIESQLPPEMEAYGTVSAEDGKLILLIAAEESSEAQLNGYFSSVHEVLNTKWGLQTTIGIGNEWEEVGWIGKSYIEASTAVDYRLIKGRNQIIFFRDIPPRVGFNYNYPVQQLKALEHSVFEGNSDETRRILDRLFTLIDQIDMPLFEVRCLCFDIINTVIKSMCMINKTQIHDNTNEYPDVISLAGFETVDELWTAVRTFSLDICLSIQNKGERQKQDMIDRMKDYIQNNFGDNQFLIQNMADHFQMSSSNLNYYFKQKHEFTISEYVNHLRMEKAKQLLLTTDFSLSEIVRQIGYSDVSSFVRKFKHTIGTTPGTFRKIHIG